MSTPNSRWAVDLVRRIRGGVADTAGAARELDAAVETVRRECARQVAEAVARAAEAEAKLDADRDPPKPLDRWFEALAGSLALRLNIDLETVDAIEHIADTIENVYERGRGDGQAGRDGKVRRQRDAIRRVEERNAALVEKLAVTWARAVKAERALEAPVRITISDLTDEQRKNLQSALRITPMQPSVITAVDRETGTVTVASEKSEVERLTADLAGMTENRHRLAVELAGMTENRHRLAVELARLQRIARAAVERIDELHPPQTEEIAGFDVTRLSLEREAVTDLRAVLRNPFDPDDEDE